ncbi:MAG: hypothetical protein M3N08_08710 [Pseudomonadota bacterium]|nr:hypothetical protein [Pseudomonadota bacterium]
MKKIFAAAVACFSVAAGLAYAQGYANPYMPAGSAGSAGTEQQQILQNALSAIMNPAEGQTPAVAQLPQQAENDLQPVAGALERIKAEQAQSISDLARERSDREFDVKALKLTLESEIHELRLRVEDQQRQIEELRHTPARY